MLSPNLYVDQKTTGRLPVAATARQCFHPVSAASRFSVPHTDRRSVFAHQTFAFNAQSLPGLAAWRDSQQNAFFQCWNGDFSTPAPLPTANRHHNFQILADNIKQRMWRNMNHQPQIAIWTAVFARRPLAFQTDALTIADARRDLHIQRFRNFLFDHAKGVINRQVIADGTLMLSKRFFEEYRHFDFNIVAACGGALTALAGMLTEN